jgi:ABC-type transport system involved in cytochrome c biogenesis permease subunit
MPSSTTPVAVTTAPAQHRGWTELSRRWRWSSFGSGPGGRFRILWLLGVVLNVAVLGLGVYLLGLSRPSVAPPASRRIAVPYAGNAALWQPLHRWVVQEDGRLKPFETFCAESVRTITGRERFEDNDPVAVVTSWLLLFEADHNRALDVGRDMNADWERYPFILCDDYELRAAFYRDYRGPDETLSEEDKHGKYIEPVVLRDSKTLKDLLKSAAVKTAEDEKAVLTRAETKAREVKKRLGLYDRIRAGGQEGRERIHAPGEFGVVALEERPGATWFSLRSLREYARRPEAWDESMTARRIENPKLYEDDPITDFPAGDVYAVQFAQEKLTFAYRSQSEEKFGEQLTAFLDVVREVNAKSGSGASPVLVARELWYNQANPFRKAWIAALAACLCFAGALLFGRVAGAGWVAGAERSEAPVSTPSGASKTQPRPHVARLFYLGGLLGYAGCLGWAAVGFWCRVTISGRPPVSNMYESIIWVAFMTATFALVLELVYRRGVIALAGALASALGFVLADQLPLTFAPNIQPLQAVLRSNYWLIIHVLTIVSSYAAFALAWALGNVNLAVLVFAPGRKDLTKVLANFCYRAIQIGVVLIAAGTLLGGFWAAESWGRFWGWDPKEVWALIALLCYVIPLHARYVGWVREFGLSVCAVVCFASVVMAWYGVNFVLGAGLHSYGFGGGNDAWVYWGGLANLSLVVHAALRYRYAGVRTVAG